jgi:hypothetical protein
VHISPSTASHQPIRCARDFLNRCEYTCSIMAVGAPEPMLDLGDRGASGDHGPRAAVPIVQGVLPVGGRASFHTFSGDTRQVRSRRRRPCPASGRIGTCLTGCRDLHVPMLLTFAAIHESRSCRLATPNSFKTRSNRKSQKIADIRSVKTKTAQSKRLASCLR